jgi:hypothetical protein
VAGLAGANTEADGEVGLAGPGWSEEDDVLFAVMKSSVPRCAIVSRFNDLAWS